MTLSKLKRAALASLLALIVTPAAGQATDLSGMWWIKDRSETVKVVPPLLPKAVELYKLNQALLAAGKIAPQGNQPCIPLGLPRLMLAPYPFQILQRPTQVTFIHERMHMFRLIPLNKQQPKDLEELDPAYNGHSVAVWEGDTLVVDTAGLKGNTLIDKTGIPHSDNMRLLERFTLTDGGQTLTDRVTVTDPETFSKPWSFTLAFAKRPDVQLMDDVCTYGPPERDQTQK
jgi:hypothetical protein